MLPQSSHITAKRGVYYFRRRLPSPWQGEVALSLRTRNFREAQHLGTVLDRAFREFFGSYADMSETDSRVQQILQDELARTLSDELARHQSTPWGQPVYCHDAEGPDVRREDIEMVDGFLAEARSDLVSRHVGGLQEYVDELLEKHALPAEASQALAFGLLKIRVRRLEKARQWLEHGPVDDGLALATKSPLAPVIAPAAAPSAGKLLSELLPGFLDLMQKDEGWRGQTLAQNSATYRMFIEQTGDKQPMCYTRQDFAAFYDSLRALPSLYAKSREWRGLTIAAIGEQTRGVTIERLSMKTIKRHFSALGRLFGYLKRRGEIVGENPAHGFDFPLKGRASDKRQMWDGDRLTQLFASPVWTGCQSQARRSSPGNLVIRDEKYWLPILGLYHGNRLEEFAQLRREDIRCEEKIWCFDINGEGERQIKNLQSKRRVPMHPKVLGLGFLEYVESTAPNPTDLIFPELRPGGPDSKLGFYFTKWWSRYRQEIGLYERGLDYHSFRHGVTTKLFAAGVSEAIVDEITGHEGKGTSRAVYKKDLPLRVLHEAIAKIDWPEVKLGAPSEYSEKNSERP